MGKSAQIENYKLTKAYWFGIEIHEESTLTCETEVSLHRGVYLLDEGFLLPLLLNVAFKLEIGFNFVVLFE